MYILNKVLLIAEDGEEYDHLPEWQQVEIKIARHS